MAESITKPEEGGGEEGGGTGKSMAESAAVAAAISRKEKRKERKKMKRKQVRRAVAEREREEEEAKLYDPEEQKRAKEMEEEEKQRMERERKEFEEREKKWLEEMERRRKLQEEEQEQEEERRKILAEENHAKKSQENGDDDDGDWEYVEEGPAEIIWQGNEIIFRKKRVKVPKKKNADQLSRNEEDQPTSNPLPPQSEAFAQYRNVSMVSAEQMLENVAQQVPNFGTEQDKAHCPFHLKTGACRFGQRCSRVHFYPDKANTLLMKNMYNGPGLAWEQDEGLEHTDEEVERCYEEFYEDVHTEFLKYGEIVNFKVCKNGSFHLRGNVYVQYKSLDSAVLAYCTINGRYFAGKQVNCEFVNVTRWKVAICGEYMKSRLKICSRGTACNFIHCFRNPGGDYEWADWDKPPPRYWIKKMTALFGYPDESAYAKQMEHEKFDSPRMSSKTRSADTDRHRSSRSRSRDINHSLPCSSKNSDDEDVQGTHWHWHTDGDRKHIHVYDEKSFEKDYHHSECRSHDSTSDGDSEPGREGNKHQGHVRKRSRHSNYVTERSSHLSSGKIRDRNRKSDSDEWSDGGRNRQKKHAHTEGSGQRIKGLALDRDRKNESNGLDGCQSDREKHYSLLGRSSRQHNKVRSTDDLGDGKALHWDKDRDRHEHPRRKNSSHHRSSLDFPDDHQDDWYRTHDSDSWSGKNRESDRTHKRRCSRRSEQEISDDEGIASKRLKEKSYSKQNKIEKSSRKRSIGCQSSRQIRSHRKSTARSSSDESLNGNKDHGSSHAGHVSRYKSIVETNELDRWKPESPD